MEPKVAPQYERQAPTSPKTEAAARQLIENMKKLLLLQHHAFCLCRLS